jgi:monoterpene epsilon-lactone hydrolase
MASNELARAIDLERSLLQEFSAAQTPEEFRSIYGRFLGQFQPPADVEIQPVKAGDVPAEWVMPTSGPPAGRTILYFHGGGYVIGSPKDYRETVSHIARAAQARALIIDYRLAPENPHPAAVEDAVAAYRWLLGDGVEPSRIVLAGDSAGGGLTIATLVALRDRGDRLPAAGVCICPWVDMECSGKSMEVNADADPLVKRDLVAKMAAAYLQGQDPRTALASPLHADLRGLPPLLIQAGQSETLLDDAGRLAERATIAGVDVTYEPWPEMIHVWHWFGSFLPEARQAIDRVGEFVKERAPSKKRRGEPPPGHPKETRPSVSVLPMEIRAGDRLTGEQGEWEVDTHPDALHGGKALHARLRKVGERAVVRYVTWPVHEKVTIRRRS